MELPDVATPEALFRWLQSRGVLTAGQASEAIDAVRRDAAEETAGSQEGGR